MDHMWIITSGELMMKVHQNVPSSADAGQPASKQACRWHAWLLPPPRTPTCGGAEAWLGCGRDILPNTQLRFFVELKAVVTLTSIFCHKTHQSQKQVSRAWTNVSASHDFYTWNLRSFTPSSIRTKRFFGFSFVSLLLCFFSVSLCFGF